MISRNEQFRRMLVESERTTVAKMWEVRNHQPVAERVSKIALCAALKQPAVRVCAKKIIAATQGYIGNEYIGEGRDQKVFRKGDIVTKELKCAEVPGGENADDIAKNLQEATDKCQLIMGRHWTPTAYDVKTSKRTGQRVVVATQPFVRSLELYNSADELMTASVSTGEKHLFAGALRALHEETGWYADIAAPGNVSSTERGLQVVDTIPVFPDIQQGLIVADGRQFGTYLDERIDQLAAVG